MGYQIGRMGYQIGRMGYQIWRMMGHQIGTTPCPLLASLSGPAPVWPHPCSHLAPPTGHPNLAVPQSMLPPPIWLGWGSPPPNVHLRCSFQSHLIWVEATPCVNNIFHLAWKNSQNSREATPFPSIKYSPSHQINQH